MFFLQILMGSGLQKQYHSTKHHVSYLKNKITEVPKSVVLYLLLDSLIRLQSHAPTLSQRLLKLSRAFLRSISNFCFTVTVFSCFAIAVFLTVIALEWESSQFPRYQPSRLLIGILSFYVPFSKKQIVSEECTRGPGQRYTCYLYWWITNYQPMLNKLFPGEAPPTPTPNICQRFVRKRNLDSTSYTIETRMLFVTCCPHHIWHGGSKQMSMHGTQQMRPTSHKLSITSLYRSISHLGGGLSSKIRAPL